MSKSTAQKIECIEVAWKKIITAISESKVIKWTDIYRESGTTWSSGSQSIGSILITRLKWLEGKKNKPLDYTDKFRNSASAKTSTEIAKIILRQVEGWVVTPKGPKGKKPQSINPATGETITIDLDPMEQYGLRTIIGIAKQSELQPAVSLIAEQILEKLK